MINALLFSCCALATGRTDTSSALSPVSPEDYRLEITENLQRRRFDLRLVSTTSRELCLGEHQWPNSLGQLHFAERDVFVIVADQKYYVRAQNFGYPEGTLRIPARGELTGFVSFDEIAAGWTVDPTTPRRLVFEVRPSYCNQTARPAR